MNKPVLSQDFWRERFEDAVKHRKLHHAVYRINDDGWRLIEEQHRRILARHILPNTKVLEVGCGYGRLTTLLPRDHKGTYLGYDLSPTFIDYAKLVHLPLQQCTFVCGRAEEEMQKLNDKTFDLGITVSVRNMLIDNGYETVWNNVFREMTRVCTKVLTLEYDATDEGVVTQ